MSVARSALANRAAVEALAATSVDAPKTCSAIQPASRSIRALFSW
jgi:hypothetical protein